MEITRGIREDEIHLWTAFTDDFAERRVLEFFHSLLDRSEIEQHAQFAFEQDRQLYLVSHALVRLALSQYSDTVPPDWKFSRNEYGKPEVANPGKAFHFGLI